MRRNIIIIAFIISACAHAIGFSAFSLYTNAKGNPVIYFWPNIIEKVDGDAARAQALDAHIPERALISTQQLARDYFSVSESLPRARVNNAQTHYPATEAPVEIDNATPYMYLWEKAVPEGDVKQEQVSYKAFVSPSGKVIFLYPQKLPVNSYANLLQEAYTRESVIFLNDKFSWTKIEAVVQ